MMKLLVLSAATILAIYAMPFDVFAPHDPCNTCTFIVGRAEHHFRPNETESQLKHKLDKECRRLGQLQGQEAGEHCLKIIDSHIDIIYNDIKAGKRPHQICIDIGECSGPSPSGVPASSAVPVTNVPPTGTALPISDVPSTGTALPVSDFPSSIVPVTDFSPNGIPV